MPSKLLLALVLTLAVTGCARRGVLVDKTLRPSPFAYSTGIDGVYTFLLRDEQGRVHRQMVTPDVFSRYEVGDYFDDQQAGPVRHEEGFSKDNSDSKTVRPVRTASRRSEAKPVAHHAAPKKTTVAHHKMHKRLRVVAAPRDDDPAAPQEGPLKKSGGLEVQP